MNKQNHYTYNIDMWYLRLRETNVVKISEVGSEGHVVVFTRSNERNFTDHKLIQVLLFCCHVIVAVEYQFALEEKS